MRSFYLLLCRGFMKSNYLIIFMCLLCPVFLYAGEVLHSSLTSFEQKQLRDYLKYIQKDVSKRQDLTTDIDHIYLLLHNYNNLPDEHRQQTQQDIKNYFGAGITEFFLRVKSAAFVDSEGDCYLYTSQLISACDRQTATMMEKLIFTLSGSEAFIKKTVQSSDLEQGRVGYPTLAPCSTPGSCAAPADLEERSAQEVIRCDHLKIKYILVISAAALGAWGAMAFAPFIGIPVFMAVGVGSLAGLAVLAPCL